jgi:hypothetical protein
MIGGIDMREDKVFVSNLDLTPENGISPEEKRFSKINGQLCKLKMKVFSSTGEIHEVEFSSENDINPVTSIELGDNMKEKVFNESENESQKSYSAGTIRERVRMSKFSPRQRFRRMIIDYKKYYDMTKGKMTHDDFVLVKGLFVSDVMNIMNLITPEVRKGKQINTLLGLSAFGKDLRVAGQKMQMPYRMALNEEVNVGAPSKKRYMDIQETYNGFIDALLRHVFGENYKNIGINETASMISEATSDVQPTTIGE